MAAILIVDDLAASREVLVRLLRAKGHDLMQAENGEEALTMMEAELPDLVITDLLMPVMDGFEFVRQLRIDPVTSTVPVLFSTAHYDEHEAKELALATGVSHVLIKPTSAEHVLEVVDRVLAEKSRPLARTDSAPLQTTFDREHLRLITDKLSHSVSRMQLANTRLRALVDIALDLASERDSANVLQKVCDAARGLFDASYVTLGIVSRSSRTVEHFATSGLESADWIKVGDRPRGILRTVVKDHRTLRGDNPYGKPARLDLPQGHPIIQAYLATPVASPGLVHGWICLVNNEGRLFTNDDEQLLLALAGQVGRIYENGYYYRLSEVERDRAQRYLDTAEVILLALDVNGRVTQANRYACSVLGWPAHELLGRDWADTCLPERMREPFQRKFHQILAHGSVVESPVRTRSGEERLIEWRSIVLRDDEGRPTGTFSSGTDVTVRAQAEKALREAEERTKFALQNAGAGLWDMDVTTGQLQWSDIMETHYGVEPGTFRGTFDAFIERIHPEDRASVLATFGQATRAGGDFQIEHRALWPDGTVRWLSGRGRVIADKNGETVRAVGISLDVTERRTLEEQYRQAQKMEAVGRLAGGIAHDFNNLLGVIMGSAELLLMDLEPGDPREVDVVEIQKAGERAAGLTRQLLAFSRKQIIEPTLFDLNAILVDMLAMLRRLIGEDVVVMVIPAASPAWVNADRGQIEQVVMNLAVNARDAMPDGGRLTIEASHVVLDGDYLKRHVGVTSGHYVSLVVSDTGTGITPETQARLFEPFFTTKEIGKGTGLGLATVHGIVTGSGGTIDVYSEVGVGTSFKVYLPRADNPDEESAERSSIATQPIEGTQTVLLVEDEEGLREITTKLLERLGYTVLVAASALEALELFEAHADQVDVLLTDVVMPGGSGPDLTRQLVPRRPTLKVIYMSGYTEEAIVHHGVLKPGIAFLSKPVTHESLGRKLREVLDR